MLYSGRKTFISGLLCWALMLSLCVPVDADIPQSQPLALHYAGVFSLRQIDPNLTGNGVHLSMVCRSMTYLGDKPLADYRPDFAHNCLLKTPVTFHDFGEEPPNLSSHATAIASILFGRDPNASTDALGSFNYLGVVPDAEAQVHQFDHFVHNNIVPQKPPVGDVVTMSFGDTFETWWTRGIESLAERNGLIFVAAIGNGADAYDPPLYPAAGANVIAVGVVDSVSATDLATRLANFTLARPAHSTYGPTGVGRCKPDIVAPGNCLVAEPCEPNVYSPSGDYSSFAAPVVSGIAGLLVQKAQGDPALAPAVTGPAKNCLIKAILLNSATKLPFWHKGLLTEEDDRVVPLDYIQGAGMVNARGAFDQLTAGRARPGIAPPTAWDKNVLDSNEHSQRVYRIEVPEPAG
ncbi:MAG: S8 family peptidase, partial [Planctomycetota bacterium]